MQRVSGLPGKRHLQRQKACALALLDDSIRPFGAGETLAQFVRRPFQYLAAHEMLMKTALQRTCAVIESSEFALSPHASAKFREAVLKAVSEWQSRSH
jgi:hypothetical protein